MWTASGESVETAVIRDSTLGATFVSVRSTVAPATLLGECRMTGRLPGPLASIMKVILPVLSRL